MEKNPKFKFTKLLFLCITQVFYIKADICSDCCNAPLYILKHFNLKEYVVDAYLKSG